MSEHVVQTKAELSIRQRPSIGQRPSAVERPSAEPVLRKSDAIWLQRGERLGEILLEHRMAAYGLVGVCLTAAALLLFGLPGPPEPLVDMTVQR